MKDRGLKAVSVVQTAVYLLLGIIWTAAENRAEIVAMIVLAWALFALGAVKVAVLFIPMTKRYSAVFAGLAFAADMAVTGALLTLYFVSTGIAVNDAAAMFSDIFLVAAILIIAIAEAAAFVCGAASHVEEK